jgi:hypothetical protein
MNNLDVPMNWPLSIPVSPCKTRRVVLAALLALCGWVALSGWATQGGWARGQETSPSDTVPATATAPVKSAVQSPVQSPVQAAAKSPVQACTVFRVRPQDQIWAVSTRCLGCPAGGSAEPGWTVWHYESGRWVNSTTAALYATDSPEIVTPIFVHGNRVEDGQALSDGLAVYFQLAGKFDHEPPVRFIIWSWPSAQIRGPLNDVRTKAYSSDTEAYYVARFLAGMSPEVRAGLVGFSYGARIIGGALHGLGGGRVAGHTLLVTEHPKLRVVFWAAAENSDWLVPGRYHGQALPEAEAWLNLINYCDPALAQYWRLDKCASGDALGYTGLYGRNLLTPEINARFHELNVTHLIGKIHDMPPYLYSLPVQNATREYALWHEL